MTVAAVERGLRILEQLAGEPEPVELVELARILDIPPSAAHRTVSVLAERGWVVQEETTQKYALSLRMSTLAFRNLDVRAVSDAVQAILDNLARETCEYCRLAIVEGEDLVWVARAQGARSGLRYDPDMGQEIVLHATANGKAWLSTLAEEEAIRIVKARGLRSRRPLGPNSATQIPEIRQRIRDTARTGYGASIEEAEPGTAAVAVPFRASQEPGAPVAGTISVAGPLLRVRPERFDELAAALKNAARQIETIWPLRRRMRGERQFAAAAADPELSSSKSDILTRSE
ncbi:IclR family transcriptional regulator [Pseudohoeflea coraliihabitans]|uniref:IclR family transcriptional regulator n=1 Tax=Pseudohoeflea coraliihabitans TaxID=2860393 RepID=A0ABS6WJK9_9HYPH|nr:IclR family transcriptional regulator [Pseudohoeflea sp. DP4N28-3]MBW3096040.1 IclR family transcriptional regulator [Pseudohoeflea sp. DP4N28-3]